MASNTVIDEIGCLFHSPNLNLLPAMGRNFHRLSVHESIEKVKGFIYQVCGFVTQLRVGTYVYSSQIKSCGRMDVLWLRRWELHPQAPAYEARVESTRAATVQRKRAMRRSESYTQNPRGQLNKGTTRAPTKHRGSHYYTILNIYKHFMACPSGVEPPTGGLEGHFRRLDNHKQPINSRIPKQPRVCIPLNNGPSGAPVP